jgi:MFS family permease
MPTSTATHAVALNSGRVRHGAGFWIIASAFLTVMAFSTVPTPLYAIYQQRDGFATFFITVIFAAYAVGVAASLYLAGHVSDWLGRRRVLVAAILVEVVSAVVFLAWPEVPGLIVARFICGVGVGALTATATAHIAELGAVASPERGTGRSTTISGFANIAGLAVGPLVAGYFAQYVAAPLVVPYVVFAVLMVLAAIAVSLVPETVERTAEHHAYRPQRVSLPAASRATFAAAGAGAVAAFAIFGLFTSLAPSFLAGTLHEASRLLAGVVTFAVFGAAAVAQVVFARLSGRTQLKLAIVLMSVGLVAMSVGVLVVSLVVFIVAGVVAGAGVGILFRSSIGVAASLAQPSTRGEVLAAMFLVAYIGLAAPVLLIGLALAFLPSTWVLVGFAAVVMVVVIWSGVRMIADGKQQH